MSGLLVKDFLIIRRRCSPLYGIAVVGLLVGVFFLFPQEAAIFVPLLLGPCCVASLAELAVSDEKSGWKSFLPGLPLTRREIVWTRYVFCGMLLAGASAVGLGYGVLSVLLFGHWGVTDILLAVFGGLVLGLLLTIVGVPCAFFCKGEAATASMMGVMLLAMLVRYSGAATAFMTLNLWVMIPAVFGGLLVLAGISFRLSLLIYTSKIQLGRF